jgi:hypothetical protein
MDLSIIDLLMYLRKFQSIDFSIYRTISLSIYIYLSIYPSVCLSVRPSVHPSVCPSTHPSLHSSIYLYCVFSCHILPSLFYSSVLDSILCNLSNLSTTSNLSNLSYPILSTIYIYTRYSHLCSFQGSAFRKRRNIIFLRSRSPASVAVQGTPVVPRSLEVSQNVVSYSGIMSCQPPRNPS